VRRGGKETLNLRRRWTIVLVVASVAGPLLATGAESSVAASAAYRLRPVASVRQPTFVTAAPGEPSRLYVVERRGTVRVLENGRLRTTPFLNVSGAVSTAGERGLLSVAFHPEYVSNRLVYACYVERDGAIKVVEFRVANDRVDMSSARVVVRVPHDEGPYHNGGQIAFGPDRLLYVGIGDGGYLGPEPDPYGNSQNLHVLLGKIFRIAVGDVAAKPEIVAYGLRNPWRFSFDTAGRLIIGEVGWRGFEEIDVLTPDAGLVNFGWSVYEGRRKRRTDVQQNPAGTLTWPVHTYSTNIKGNCSVTGGYVYRGRAITSLRDRYVFGDYCSGRIWSAPYKNGRLGRVRLEPVRIRTLSSFGLDGNGELYGVALSGSIHRFVRR
jgi:glucose/arabinose dehydrogenase